MTKSNAKVLLILLVILLLAGSYMYVFKPNMEDKDALKAEVATLEERYNELKAKEANRETYITETAEFYVLFDEIVKEFPADLNQEVSVMFLKGVQEAVEFEIQSVGLGAPTEFYTLGAASVSEDPNTPVVEAATSGAAYQCYSAKFPISYEGSYDGIKDFISYIMNYRYRMNIDSVSITYNADDDTYTGSVSLNAYAVSGEGREPDTVNVDVNNGVGNIFHGGEGASSPSSYSYDADNGAGIVTDHDLVIMLNNANGDGADGIIVAKGNDDKDSYVTSSDNEVKDLKITVYQEDAKIYAKYEIGDSSYEVEVTSTDLTIYVDSSSRVDADDANGIKVSVDNSTAIPVFFKVADDDATSPRFDMNSKTGTVKVY